MSRIEITPRGKGWFDVTVNGEAVNESALRFADAERMVGNITRRSETAATCGCGCGTTTDRRFAPGHDAKLKSTLLRIIRKGEGEVPEVARPTLATVAPKLLARHETPANINKLVAAYAG